MGNAPPFWRQRSWSAASLLPLAAVFGGLAALRRGAYRCGVLRREQLPVPVVVVGNIAVGGSGKTPAVLWLVEELRKAGKHPGIVSRGHGGQASQGRVPCLVTADSDPDVCGDEPVLLARQAGCPVAVGRDRPGAARLLLVAHPECDVIVSDDGMQHYRLPRRAEIAVVNEAALGNGWLLPAGPLREPPSRLAAVDLLIAHGDLSPCLRRVAGSVPLAAMRLEGGCFRSLADPTVCCGAEAFAGKKVHAIAGIGQPQRFFSQLAAMGLDIIPHPFPDHYRYRAADLDFAPGEPKLMTSKDAVKCSVFSPPDAWELPVRAVIDEGAIAPILEKLDDGRQVA